MVRWSEFFLTTFEFQFDKNLAPDTTLNMVGVRMISPGHIKRNEKKTFSLKRRLSPGKDGLPVAKKWLDTINLSIRIGSLPEWTMVTVVGREDGIVYKNDIVTKKSNMKFIPNIPPVPLRMLVSISHDVLRLAGHLNFAFHFCVQINHLGIFK